MTLTTRPISWIKAALMNFEGFPEAAQAIVMNALTIAAEGDKADIAKPWHAMGSGVFEIALPFRGNAFRVIYAVQLADEILGHTRFPEKISSRYQDAKTRF